MKINTNYNHPIKCFSKTGLVYVATELCSNGSLEKYLRSQKSGYVSLSEARYVTYGAMYVDNM